MTSVGKSYRLRADVRADEFSEIARDDEPQACVRPVTAPDALGPPHQGERDAVTRLSSRVMGRAVVHGSSATRAAREIEERSEPLYASLSAAQKRTLALAYARTQCAEAQLLAARVFLASHGDVESVLTFVEQFNAFAGERAADPSFVLRLGTADGIADHLGDACAYTCLQYQRSVLDPRYALSLSLMSQAQVQHDQAQLQVRDANGDMVTRGISVDKLLAEVNRTLSPLSGRHFSFVRIDSARDLEAIACELLPSVHRGTLSSPEGVQVLLRRQGSAELHSVVVCRADLRRTESGEPFLEYTVRDPATGSSRFYEAAQLFELGVVGAVLAMNRASVGAEHGLGAARVAASFHAPLRTLSGHTERVKHAAISRDTKTIVSAGVDHTVRVWDAGTGALRHTLRGHTDVVEKIALSSDASIAVSASCDATINVWKLNDGQCLHTLRGHDAHVSDVALTPDGKTLVSASGDGCLRVWDVSSGQAIHTLSGHEGAVHKVLISADGERAVSYGEDNTLRVWRIESGRLLHTLGTHTERVAGMAWSPDGKRFASADIFGAIKVWDLTTGCEEISIPGAASWSSELAFSADGNTLVSALGHDGQVQLWNAHTGQPLGSLQEVGRQVNRLVLSPDGQVGIFAKNFRLVVCELASGKVLHTIDSPDVVGTLSVSHDGAFVVQTGWGTQIQLWDGAALGLRKAKGANADTLPANGQLSTKHASRDAESALTLRRSQLSDVHAPQSFSVEYLRAGMPELYKILKQRVLPGKDQVTGSLLDDLMQDATLSPALRYAVKSLRQRVL